jgi:hypothetical protein
LKNFYLDVDTLDMGQDIVSRSNPIIQEWLSLAPKQHSKHFVFKKLPRKGSVPWSPSQSSLLSPRDEMLPAHTSAFDYAIAPFVKDFKRSDPLWNLLSPTASTSSTVSESKSEFSSFSSTRNERLYPHRSDRYILPEELQSMTIDERLRFIALRAVLMRCTILSRSIAKKNDIFDYSHMPDYPGISKITRRYALPIAKSLGMNSLQGLCWYWIGRGEAGREEWDAAIEAFENAIRFDVMKEGKGITPNKEGKDALYWLQWVQVARDQRKPSQTSETAYDMKQYLNALDAGEVDPDSLAEQLSPTWHPGHRTTKKEDFTTEEWVYITAPPKIAQ